ncbi:MAG: type II toxin-antitoxin system HicB family antitoxin [Chloroflexi bacterium]|nr:type II toxin-antitoxin system HicB family antitoxin [Chloroflexota bacterium]
MEKRKVTVILFPSVDGGYTAFMPLFPDCTTSGDTAQEAFKAAKESLELLFEDPSEDDLENLELSYVDHVTVGDVEIEVNVPAKA